MSSTTPGTTPTADWLPRKTNTTDRTEADTCSSGDAEPWPGDTADFGRAAKEKKAKANGNTSERKIAPPKSFTADELLALDIPEPQMLIPGLLPMAGACLLFGALKSNKTLIAVQIAIAVTTKHALFDYYSIAESGPVMILEQDDPGSEGSIKSILSKSRVPANGIPLRLYPRDPRFSFGQSFIDWLKAEITENKRRLVVLDSYTALRPSRGHGIDIVKVEHAELTMLDVLAKETNCCILVIHHDSKGSVALDWSQRAGGTYAMGAAVEALIHTMRFPELASNADERLVQVRGRHVRGTEMVLRFIENSLDHDHIIEGPAAPLYPLLKQIHSAFGDQVFTPKGLIAATGVSHSTAHRQIERLHQADALTKVGYGEYKLAAKP
jgi:hypothetical protein